ncbi:MAG: hypothetical protein ABIK79_14765 [Chloroflexota bacterium]
MEEMKRVTVLENAIQAQLLDSILTERNIPHVMVSYRDSAYDGIYQLRRGWGHVEAPERYREEIAAILEDLSREFYEEQGQTQ